MGVIVTKTENQEVYTPKPFPKLMKSSMGNLFYMVRDRYGLPLDGVNWDFEEKNFADFKSRHLSFEDYNELITIQNA